jgi:hypothetical protein
MISEFEMKKGTGGESELRKTALDKIFRVSGLRRLPGDVVLA